MKQENLNNQHMTTMCKLQHQQAVTLHTTLSNQRLADGQIDLNTSIKFVQFYVVAYSTAV